MASEGAALDWGNGMSATLFDRGNGRFELEFAGKPPSTKKVKIDAIDRAGKCRPLVASPAVEGSTIIFNGQTADAYRARVYIIEDDGPIMREVALSGAAPMAYVRGPEGGSLIMIGHDGESATAEVLDAGPKSWKLTFEDEGQKIKAPRVIDVEVEAIAPSPGEGQIRMLTVAPGPDPFSLLANGEIGGAAYIRLAIRDGNHWHTRCVPLTAN